MGKSGSHRKCDSAKHRRERQKAERRIRPIKEAHRRRMEALKPKGTPLPPGLAEMARDMGIGNLGFKEGL